MDYLESEKPGSYNLGVGHILWALPAGIPPGSHSEHSRKIPLWLWQGEIFLEASPFFSLKSNCMKQYI